MPGNGTVRKKIAMKARPAMNQCTGECSAFLATFSKASTTMTSTAALTPRNSAAMTGRWPTDM